MFTQIAGAPGSRPSAIPESMCRVAPRLVLFLACTLGALASTLNAQQAPDGFRWIDFHSPADQDVVVWVTHSLDSDKWTAIREIGVEYDASLVVTTDRASPQAAVASDTFSMWSVSLTTHMVTALLKGVNLRFVDWMMFAQGETRELGAFYDDCADCSATTYFTAFYYDQRQHGWAMRWMRGNQAVPFWTAQAAPGVTLTQVSAILADPNGHEMVGTWKHYDYGTLKPAEDFVYQYDIDPMTSLDRAELLSNKQVEPMQRRLCVANDAVSGLARGQDAAMCRDLLHPEIKTPRRSPSSGARPRPIAPEKAVPQWTPPGPQR